MGKIINLTGSGILNLNEGVKSPIDLDMKEVSGMLIKVLYPKKYITPFEGGYAIDYEKIKKDGFNTVLSITNIGEWNNIVTEPNEVDNTFKIVIEKWVDNEPLITDNETIVTIKNNRIVD